MTHKLPEKNQHRTMQKGDPLRYFTIHQFLSDHYAHLFDKLEEYLISECDQYSATINTFERRSSKEDLNSWAFATLYPNTVRYSTFITLYKQFEYTLTEACLELEKDHPNRVELKDLKDKGIRRAHTYLRKVVEIKDPFLTPAWQKLQDLTTLRNFIIHNDAIIKTDTAEQIKLVQRINVWAPVVIKEARIVLSKNFIKHVSQFFHEQAEYVAKKLMSACWE